MNPPGPNDPYNPQGTPPPPYPGVYPPPPAQPGGAMYAPGVYTVDAKGTTILVLGVLSLFCFGVILGTIAFVMGNNSIAAIDSGLADPSERGKVSAGRILGGIGGVLSVLSGIAVFVIRSHR